VVALLGPAEIERGIAMAADVVLAGAALPRVAAVLRRADRYVGNDSGISHLAGLVGARALVLFADSDSRVWAPSGPHVTVLHAAPPCDQCGPGAFCIHRLPVTTVLSALG
jgi:ADP-heptose:LPS heptosyltransferase